MGREWLADFIDEVVVLRDQLPMATKGVYVNHNTEVRGQRLRSCLAGVIFGLPIACFTCLIVIWIEPTSSQEGPRWRSSPTVAAQEDSTSKLERRTIRSIKGRIVFVGEIPKLAPLVAPGGNQTDNAICTKDGPIRDESLLIDSKTRGIANVFVYFDRRPEGAPASDAAAKTISIKTEGCRIYPHAVVGRTVDEFEYSFVGPALHNLRHSPVKNSTSNQNPVLNGSYSVRFKTAERRPFEVSCGHHNWMRSHILVLDHGYAVVTNEAGEFVLNDVPVGTHKLRLWHERGGLQTRDVTVRAEGDLDLGKVEHDGARLK